VSVTLRTPRDIRTLTPIDGLFLAVYDGAFYGGQIVAIGHRRDGSTYVARTPGSGP
jgi:ABC-type phosphonate transport system ATPase subunit